MPTIRITKKGGECDTQTAIEWLKQQIAVKANGDYELTLARAQKHRTLPQNRLMWMWFKCIEDETGQPSQDLHDYFCKRYTLEPITNLKGQREMIVRGTRNLNTEQFTDFLNKVQAEVATELGITLPTPEDLAFADFERAYGY